MSNNVFRQNLNDKKGPQPGGPYLIQMLFQEPVDMPVSGGGRRYEQMEDSFHKKIMLKNFDCALADPGREDLEQLKKAALAAD